MSSGAPERLPKPIQRVFALLERHTKTDMTYLATGGFWLTVDQVIGGFISFLLIVGFGHFVSPQAYGTYRYLLATFWTLAAFTLTGIPTALSRAVANGYDGAFMHSLRWSILGGLPLSIIGICMSAYYFTAGNTLLGWGLISVALLGPLMQPAHLFGPYLAGKKDFRRMTLLGIVFAMVPACALGVAMLLTQNPLIFFLIYLVGYITVGIALCAFIFLRWRPTGKSSSDLYSLSGHFSVMNLLATVAAQVDKVIVFHYLGAVELAVYSFAVAIPEQIKGMFGAVSVLALPKFATRSLSEIRRNFWNRLLMLTVVLFLASLVYVALAPLAFNIFFPKYMNAVWYSQLFALSLVLTSISLPTTLLQAKGAKWELYVFNTVSPTVQIVALILLTAMYGLTGTICARIVGRAFSLGLGSILALKHLKHEGNDQISTSIV